MRETEGLTFREGQTEREPNRDYDMLVGTQREIYTQRWIDREIN